MCAIKKMTKTDLVARGHVERAWTEWLVQSEADGNEWLVKLHFCFQTAEHVYLVMDYVPGGDLMGLLMRLDVLPEPQARFYAAEAVQAIASLHGLGYAHRDIKPDNFLLDRQGHVKLADLGLAKCVASQLEISHTPTNGGGRRHHQQQHRNGRRHDRHRRDTHRHHRRHGRRRVAGGTTLSIHSNWRLVSSSSSSDAESRGWCRSGWCRSGYVMLFVRAAVRTAGASPGPHRRQRCARWPPSSGTTPSSSSRATPAPAPAETAGSSTAEWRRAAAHPARRALALCGLRSLLAS